MNAIAIFLFLIIPLVDMALWVAWTRASSNNKRYLVIALAAIAIPQAGFVFYVLTRIGIALFTGAKL